MQRFSHVDTWVFDLDHTLYDAESHVFVQVLQRANEFLAGHFNISLPQAEELRESYYKKYGVSWMGLMAEAGMAPDGMMSYMHDIDITPVVPFPITREYIERLPGKKYVFTNSPRDFATRMMTHLGLDNLFDGVFTVEDTNFAPKPSRNAFDLFLKKYNIDPKKSCMFEDTLANLETAHALGMTTVWCHWAKPPQNYPYVHHKVEKLPDWLLSTLSKA